MPLFSPPRVSSITKADLARAAGDWKTAARHYAEALTRNPARPEIWVQYGHALKESGRRLDAEGAYRRAAEVDPAAADAHLHLGHLLKLEGREEEAKAAYLRALALAPELADARGALTELGLGDGEIAEARAALPPLPPPRRRRPSRITRADRARELGQWAEAARLYRQVLARNPRNAPIWVQYGHMLRQQGDPSGAETAYCHALACDPKNADSYVQLGHALKAQDKTEEAQSAYLRAFVLEPDISSPGEELRKLGWTQAQVSAFDSASRGGSEVFSSPAPEDLGDCGPPPSISSPLHARPIINAEIIPQTLLVSILSLGRADNVARLLRQLPGWLSEISVSRNISIFVSIRNNNPNANFGEIVGLINELKNTHHRIQFNLFDGGPNIGFGRGHNENYKHTPTEYLIILNDDLSFPNIDWVYSALDMLQHDEQLAFIGAEDNPHTISPFYANGHFPNPTRVDTLRYVEASVMVARGSLFQAIGMFNDQIEWAMCEDTDLSLRAQRLGYRIQWLSIPHEHWRSSSFNSLPTEVKSSILEHNRATLLATWKNSFASGVVGEYEVFDLWSDGMGDVFTILPDLWTYLSGLSHRQQELTIINTKAPDLISLVAPAGVRIESSPELGLLELKYGLDKFTTVRTMRGVNYSIPIHMRSYLCGTLGLPLAPKSTRAEFAEAVRSTLQQRSPSASLLKGSFCVVHLEKTRANFAGRNPLPERIGEIMEEIARQFDQIAVVGSNSQWRIEDIDIFRENRLRITDLRGKQTLSELIDLISRAAFFVGVDSFPAHVAQAFGIKSAIFFGSVHPLVWVWDQRNVWPIVAPLPCIGCYQTHLEPSIPFCMRFDEACMTMVTGAAVREQLEAMVGDAPFDWSELALRFADLQAKFFRFLHYHPAPPERLFRSASSPNERVGNLIFEITDKMAEMLGGHYQTAALRQLRARILQLESLNVRPVSPPEVSR